MQDRMPTIINHVSCYRAIREARRGVSLTVLLQKYLKIFIGFWVDI